MGLRHAGARAAWLTARITDRPLQIAVLDGGRELLQTARAGALMAVAEGTPHPALLEPEGEGWIEEVIPRSALVPLPGAEVTWEPAGDHSLRIEVSSQGARGLVVFLAARARERYWGFGERSDLATRREGTVENWVGEGPYQLAEYPLLSAITPRWALRRRRDATYFPVPWVISSAGYALLVENSELSWFALPGRRRSWAIGVLAPRLRLRVFGPGSPAELLELFTAATGRQPQPAEPWFLGPWVQTGHQDLVPLEREREILERLRSGGAPLAAVETHMRRLPGGAHEGRRDAERARTRLFSSLGLPSLTYLNPFLSEDYAAVYAEAAAEGAFQRRADGSPYVFPAYIGGRQPPLTTEGQLDFATEAGRAILERVIREAVEDGHSGWMEDFGEYTPPDSVSAGGEPGELTHNLYPVTYHRSAAQAAEAAGRPLARFGRSGWTGAAAHLPLVWGGDPTTGWGFDGLASALIEGLSAGLSGIALWGSDIGGFFTLGEEELDLELLVRWIQFGALCPLMRTKAEGIAIPPRARPQVWDEEVLPHWRRWARFHVALTPYLLEAAREYAETGMPLMRHHCLTHPEDKRARVIDDQYMLGPALLVAPVLEAGARSRHVYLPQGSWRRLGGSQIRRGPTRVRVAAPLEEIPIFVREGSTGIPEPKP